MTDHCQSPHCTEPRLHNTLGCAVHWGKLPNKLKVNFLFALGRMQKNLGTPREHASTEDFKAIRTTIQETLRELDPVGDGALG